MKKVICILCALFIITGVFSACGKKDEVAEDNSALVSETASPAPENSDASSSADKEDSQPASQDPSEPDKPIVSENKKIVKDSNAPKVYVVSDMADISYHLEGCSTLAGKDVSEMPWEIVKSIGLWQCATCNPPRYEDYKNAQ